MATSRSLKTAVKTEVKQAARKADTGNVATVKETANQPAEDLPTGARRSHPAA